MAKQFIVNPVDGRFVMNGQEFTYTPHESDDLRRRARDFEEEIDLLKAEHAATTDRGEKVQITKRRKEFEEALERARTELKRATPQAMTPENAHKITYRLVRNAIDAWEEARNQVVSRLTQTHPDMAERAFSYMEEVIASEIPVEVFSRIGFQILYDERIPHADGPLTQYSYEQALGILADPKYFDPAVWAKVIEEVKEEFTHDLLNLRISRSTAMEAHIYDIVAYEAKAHWLKRWTDGYESIKATLDIVTLPLAIWKWQEENPRETEIDKSESTEV